MRTKIITASLAFICMALTAIANPIQDAWNSGLTNGAAGGGFWRSTTGNYNIASYDIVYDITPKEKGLGAGLIAGGDYLWSGKHKHVWNDTKGGFSISYTLVPFESAGYTNFWVRVYTGDCVATPRTSGVGVGNIAFVGADWTVNVYRRLLFHIDPAYQTRTGQGEFSRNYPGIQGFLSLDF